MISQGIIEELQGVLSACLYGMVITVVYDVLRIFRRVVAHNNGWIGIEDFLFWLWAGFWIFSVLYRENDGSFRMYTIFAMAVGMLLYHLTISEPLVRILGGVLKRIFDIKKLKKMVRSIIMKLLGG